uniref:Uncharacterized protein n=1 Tax=Magnetococcus massalia (strain MO-1) TaxID=451514 RepID=A0A1S7LGA0_MAGMO|nr:conserved protein of unknown function [Candidatus Magnetococcus massalia]
MTEAILSGIGQAIKQKLALEDIDGKTVKSVFSVFVEQMQNVIRYSAEQEPEADEKTSVLSYGLLTVGRVDDNYFVTCGNKVRLEDQPRLQEQLSLIQQMDPAGLKALYKQILKGEVPEGSKGAGVGFVDIARKASKPINFDFMKIDEKHVFFTLKADI